VEVCEGKEKNGENGGWGRHNAWSCDGVQWESLDVEILLEVDVRLNYKWLDIKNIVSNVGICFKISLDGKRMARVYV